MAALSMSPLTRPGLVCWPRRTPRASRVWSSKRGYAMEQMPGGRSRDGLLLLAVTHRRVRRQRHRSRGRRLVLVLLAVVVAVGVAFGAGAFGGKALIDSSCSLS